MGNRFWTIILLVLIVVDPFDTTSTEVPTSDSTARTSTVLTTTTISSTSTLSPTSTLPPTSTSLPTSTLPPTTEKTTSTSQSTTSVTTVTPTTPVPSTTAAPKPDVKEGKWNVSDGNVTCILADLKLEFTVNIGDQSYDIALFPNASSSGSTCDGSNETQILELSSQNFVLTFEFSKDSSSAYVKNITFEFTTFEGRELFYNDTKLFPVKYGNSYWCRSTETVSMGNATMHIYSIHIQAYGGEGLTDFSTAEECEADDNISDIVPIAVACALAALIVVVLIAYLVGRRKNRQKGYTSV